MWQTVGFALQGLLSHKGPNRLCSQDNTTSCRGLDVCLLCYISRSVHSVAKAMPTCKVFVNPTTETKANHDGIVHVISRMKWYYELSILLLKENTVNVKMSARV